MQKQDIETQKQDIGTQKQDIQVQKQSVNILNLYNLELKRAFFQKRHWNILSF